MQTQTRRWWQKLFGREDKFHGLLAAGAQEVKTSVGLLAAYLEALSKGGEPPALTDIADSRRRQKQIRGDTIDELNRTLMPPLDREDIQALAFALYRIPKSAEKLVERISIYPGHLPHDALRRQVELLTIAADSLVNMVGRLLDGDDIEKIAEANTRLQSAEGDADKMMLLLLRDLYEGPYSAKEVVILQSLYELMETIVDRCRNVGNIVMGIALKNT